MKRQKKLLLDGKALRIRAGSKKEAVGEQLRLENGDMPVAKGKDEGSSYIERRE
jgi:hypothetical protein